MNDSLSGRFIFLVAVAITLFPVVTGALVLVGISGELSNTERAIFGPLSLVVGLSMAAGLVLSRGSPRIGLGLVVAGALGIALLWFWMFFITIPVGLGLIWLAYRRGKGLDLPHGAETT